MAKVPRIPKAPAGKYEGKAFLDYDEAADYLGIKRTTLYHHVVDMEIETHKFKKNTRRYLAMADVKRIEKVMEEPWIEADSDKEEKRQRPEGQTKPTEAKVSSSPEQKPATGEQPWWLPEREEEKQAEDKSEPDAA